MHSGPNFDSSVAWEQPNFILKLPEARSNSQAVAVSKAMLARKTREERLLASQRETLTHHYENQHQADGCIGL